MCDCENADLTRFNREVIEEILKHKGLRSEQEHHEITNRQAAEDWIGHHYEDWLKSRLDKKD